MLQPRTTWRQTSGEVERIERNAGRAGDKSLPNASVVRRDPIAPSPAPEMICRRSKVDAPPPPLLFTPTRPGFYCQTELLQEFALEFTEISTNLWTDLGLQLATTDVAKFGGLALSTAHRGPYLGCPA